ncbi:hypothetical protein KQI38_05035 [Tissierella carlieri]|uniref:hypothetical protein n=1 Tax=Tissierella carlieri TaxID=689904 RepID=UPI001C1283CD|nr:hypothetical protein [Tissierella carlieri]MBU5311383.1 hypothetical protein [Tissierella carlieri]
MNNDISSYLDKFDDQTVQRFYSIHELIFDSTSNKIDEKLWAKLPSYYVEDKFIRIIPFKDHINIEANAVLLYKKELSEYKITPKGMLQIFHNQPIPIKVLGEIFKKTLQ